MLNHPGEGSRANQHPDIGAEPVRWDEVLKAVPSNHFDSILTTAPVLGGMRSQFLPPHVL